jgi:hypothetical protein
VQKDIVYAWKKTFFDYKRYTQLYWTRSALYQQSQKWTSFF